MKSTPATTAYRSLPWTYRTATGGGAESAELFRLRSELRRDHAGTKWRRGTLNFEL